MIQRLITANIGFLDQAADLLDGMDADTYRRQEEGLSSVGAHLRHILDHYSAFVAGVVSGAVDYDNRERDRKIEENIETAAATLGKIKQQLHALDIDALTTLRVKMDHGGPDIPWSESSPQRELQFLVSHTVHHFALIKVVLRSGSIRVSDDFGVAPSTLSYRSGRACVR